MPQPAYAKTLPQANTSGSVDELIDDPKLINETLSRVVDTGSALLEVLGEETEALRTRSRTAMETIYPRKSSIVAQYEMAMKDLARCNLTPERLEPVAARLKDIGKKLDTAVARNVIALQAALNAGFRLMDMFYRAAVDNKSIGAGYNAGGDVASRTAIGPAPALSINDTV